MRTCVLSTLASIVTSVSLSEEFTEKCPESFQVTWETTTISETTTSQSSNITIKVTRKWAPLGAERFWAMLTTTKNKFFSPMPDTGDKAGAAFFRIVPNFVVQFGISGYPAQNEKWNKAIKDDPVVKSNTRGFVTYAATPSADTRTTQIFINLKNNSGLDKERFTPFAEVVSGMDVVDRIHNPGDVSQQKYSAKGTKWLLENYPKIDYIKSTTVTK